MRSLWLGALLLAALIASAAGRLERAERARWLAYKRQHGKSYAPHEELGRLTNFRATQRAIEEHNAQLGAAYAMGLNQLSDWTRAEFAQLNGLLQEEAARNSPAAEARLAALLAGAADSSGLAQPPAELDWRLDGNRVSAVKDQRHCGSCWAFAATGALEGQQVARNYTRQLVPLSEQDLLDCSWSNFGCSGGLLQRAFDDVSALNGIASELEYPYEAVAPSASGCQFDDARAVMSDQGHAMGFKRNASALARLLATFGPVSTGMFVLDSFKSYASGVYEEPACPQHQTNHAVLLVGYGSHPALGDYWLAKNSWSEKWGERGFFKIRRGVNMCAIEEAPVIPLVGGVNRRA